MFGSAFCEKQFSVEALSKVANFYKQLFLKLQICMFLKLDDCSEAC